MAVDAAVIYGPSRAGAVVPIGPPTTLTAATSFTSATWVAEAFRVVTFEVHGVINVTGAVYDWVLWRANNVASQYMDIADVINSGSNVESSNFAATTDARIAAMNTSAGAPLGIWLKGEFLPRVSTGGRLGSARSVVTERTGTSILHQLKRDTEFAWSDTSTAMTSFKLTFPATVTFTGTIIVRGEA